MILNGYTILSVFFCLIRLLLSLAVVVIGFSSWRLAHRRPELSETIENRGYLLVLSATVLIGLNVASWPILYLLLQSYVEEWPSVMCIYGVTKIGAGTLGASRVLPTLVTTLQWTKPLVVFVSGAGYVLYLINRRTRTAQIQNRVLVVLLLTGASTFVDSVVEFAYLTIPKTEIRLEGGCCTNTLDNLQQAAKFHPTSWLTESQRPWLGGAYYSLNLALVAGLFARVAFGSRLTSRNWMWPFVAVSLLVIPISCLFLTEVAAPAILGLPFHHCAYDLVTAAPESVTAVVLFLAGCFSIGWSAIAGTFGRCDQSQPFLQDYIARLLFIALFGYAGSVLVVSLELVLA